MRLIAVIAALITCAAAPAGAQTLKDEGRFGSVALSSGFEPDPRTVEVRSGGGDAVEHLGAGCVGYIDNDEPDYVLAFTSGEYVLSFFIESRDDTTLVVRTPDGEWLCNDDYNNAGGLNPAVLLESPPDGTYHVWVGALESAVYADATLNISEKLPFPEEEVSAVGLGDDAGEYANDGECDDPRYGGDFESHRGHDATDCAAAAATAELAPDDYGDDAGEYANDGECDDPRFGGDFESHRGHDASDCRTLVTLGDDELGDDAGEYANDGECDDPRFGGLLTSHRGHDATDCAAALAGGNQDDTLTAQSGDSQPPVIEIAEIIETSNGAAEIVGRAHDETRLRRVTIDGRPVPFDAQGAFRLFRPVEVGSHEIQIAATDGAGNTSEVVVTVQSMDAAPPLIDVPEQIETAEARISIEGLVTDRSNIALLTIDGQPVVVAEQRFVYQRPVAMGQTQVTIVAIDEWGNRAEQIVTVVRSRTAVARPTPQLATPETPVAPTAKPAELRTALVIGNSNYDESPLRNPARDAKLIAESLRQRGFEVIELIDASHKEMRLAIVEFGDLLGAGGIGLFYYAGHGMQVGGENYLIPIGAEITREAHVGVEGVNVNHVLARMEGARNPMNIVILDACRNNPFARSFRSNASGLAQMLAPTGTYIAYATAPGDVAADGDGANSLFTSALASAIELPGLSLEQTFKEVRRSVREMTNGQQVPWTSSSVVGDFHFRPAAVGSAKAKN